MFVYQLSGIDTAWCWIWHWQCNVSTHSRTIQSGSIDPCCWHCHSATNCMMRHPIGCGAPLLRSFSLARSMGTVESACTMTHAYMAHMIFSNVLNRQSKRELELLSTYLAQEIFCTSLCKFRLIVPRFVVTFESLFNVITVAAFCSQLKGCMQHIPLDLVVTI